MKTLKIGVKFAFPIMLIALLILTGCINPVSKSDEDRLTGTWKLEGGKEILIIFSDGTYETNFWMPPDGTYEIKDGKLVFTTMLDGNAFSYAYDYYFSDYDTKLHLTKVGETISYTYVRQE